MADPSDESAQATEPGAKKGKKKRDAAAAPAEPRVVAPVPPKHRAQPAVGSDLGGDAFLDTAGKSIETLRENWQVIAAGILVLIVAVVFVTFRLESNKARERAAWDRYRTLDEKEGAPATADEWLAKIDDVRGTSVEPFFDLRAADLLCAEGGAEKLEKARGIYDSVAKNFSSNPVAAKLAQNGLDAVKRAQDFDPKKAAAKEPDLERAADLPPLPASATPSTATAAPAQPPK